MAKKDIVTGAAAYLAPTEVGDWIYVWSPGGRTWARDARDCVISSHGGVSATGTPRPEGTETIFYYCPHGNLMTTTAGTVAKIAAREIPYYECCRLQDNQHDYDLTKFQGTHGGPNSRVIETYRDIQTKITQAARRAEIADLMRRGFKGATQDEYDAVQETDMDVITIRNRARWRYGQPPTLYSVLQQLHVAGYHYRNVHCAFCRMRTEKDIGWSLAANRNAAPAAPAG